VNRMKKTLTQLMTKAGALPPQRPRESAYRPFLPLLMQMQDQGHTATSMADFLIQEREVAPGCRNAACRGIRNLLARHSAV
jgi:hypothetical protein